MRFQKTFDVVSIDRFPPIPTPILTDRLNAPQVTPLDPRHTARSQRRDSLRDLETQPRQLAFERCGSRLQGTRVLLLADEERLLALNELQSVALDSSVMLGVEMSKQGKVCLRLDRSAIARSRAHAIVEQRLVENGAPIPGLDDRSPEIEQLERSQALVEAANGFPHPPAQHG